MLRPVAVASVLALAATAAWADVDLELQNGDVVASSVAAGGAATVFRATLPADSFLSVAVKSAKKFPVDVRVMQDDAVELGTKSGSKVKLETLDVRTTGGVRVEVKAHDGASAGAFSLSVAWTLPTTFTTTSTHYANDQFVVPFSAVAGVEVTFTTGPATGAATTPTLDSIQDLVDQYVALGGTTATTTIPQTDDWYLFVDSGPTAGDVTTTITFKNPKPSRRKLKLVAGDVPAGATAVAAAAATKKGGHVEVDDGDAAGASVDAAKGALHGAGTLFVGTAAPFAPPQGSKPATAVFVGLARLSVAPSRTIAVTLPIAAEAGGVVRVYRLDPDGTITKLDPIDSPDTTVTVETDRGGTFEVASGRN